MEKVKKMHMLSKEQLLFTIPVLHFYILHPAFQMPFSTSLLKVELLRTIKDSI